MKHQNWTKISRDKREKSHMKEHSHKNTDCLPLDNENYIKFQIKQNCKRMETDCIQISQRTIKFQCSKIWCDKKNFTNNSYVEVSDDHFRLRRINETSIFCLQYFSDLPDTPSIILFKRCFQSELQLRTPGSSCFLSLTHDPRCW